MDDEKTPVRTICGKKEHDTMKCTACKLVIEHRPRDRDKTACEKREADLQEEALFRPPPRGDDCPICFVLLPEALDGPGLSFMGCCGKVICCGCQLADMKKKSPEHLPIL